MKPVNLFPNANKHYGNFFVWGIWIIELRFGAIHQVPIIHNIWTWNRAEKPQNGEFPAEYDGQIGQFLGNWDKNL